MAYHSLLIRQLTQFFGGPDSVPQDLHGFIEAVDRAYREAESDRLRVERSLDLSDPVPLRTNSEIQAVVQAFPDLFCHLDAEGRILDVTAGESTALALPPEKLVGQRIGETPLADEGYSLGEAFHEMQHRKTTVSAEYPLSIKNEEKFYEARFVPLPDDQSLVIIRDITTRKQTEKALRQSEDRFRRIVEMSPAAMVMVDQAARIVLTNRRTETLFGYSREELLGQPVELLIPERSRGNHEAYRRDFLLVPEARAMGQGRDLYGRRKDGSEFPAEIGLSPLKIGEETFVLSTLVDLTERKQTEERIRGMVEGISAEIGEAFFRSLVYHLGRTLEVAYTFVGELTPGREDHIRTVAVYSRGTIVENFDYALEETPCAHVVGQRLCSYPSGVQQRFPLDTLLADMNVESYLGCPLNDSAGRARGIMVVMDTKPMNNPHGMESLFRNFVDRAAAELERRRAEEELRQAHGALEARVTERTARLLMVNQQLQAEVTERKQLEEQLRQTAKLEAIGRLAGGIAHDFNNLLTVILGYSHVLLDRLPADDFQRLDIAEIKKAGERAKSLTQQLLAFSRRQMLRPKVLDLNTVVAGLEPMLRRLIGEDIHLVTVLEPRLGPVKADPGQLEQVLFNLAVNARDAMPRGGSLTIRTDNGKLPESSRSSGAVSSHRHVVLSVSDSGRGMDSETQSHIFEPFFTTKEQGEGTGLGLATVYGIIKQSGGFIDVESRPEHGTTFKIHLPQVEESIESRGAGPGKVERPSGTETVLLVEDEPGVRALLRYTLRLHGYTVLEAQDGQEALGIASQHSGAIHLIVTDMVMPRMTGREVVERLQPDRPEMKALYMSGYTEDARVDRPPVHRPHPLLQKPFTPDEMMRAIRQVLDGVQEKGAHLPQAGAV